VRHQVEVADLAHYADADLILGADGANSWLRTAHAEWFGPRIDWRRNRFVWLGTTFPFRAFTFMLKEDEHGLWRVHAYRYDDRYSTFILETTEAVWRRAGLDRADEGTTKAFTERLFARELDGHPILVNRSLWRAFPTIRNDRWHHGRVVLVGDAAHTAHFSIGSGTKLAMEDAIALAGALRVGRDVPSALAAYEAERRPQVEAIQRAAQTSLEWFEEAERYHGRLEPVQMAFSLLTRSLRVSHDNLKARDPKLVATVDAWFAAKAATQSGRVVSAAPPPPPMFTPFRLRELVLDNRVVVSPMCQYSAEDGTPNDWHLVHLGSRAVGGAGLVIAEMTDVSREGRISPGCTGLYKPEHVGAWKRVVDFVHGASRAKIGIQIAHAGRKGSTRLMWQGMDEPLDDPVSPAEPGPARDDARRHGRRARGFCAGGADGRRGGLRSHRDPLCARLSARDLPVAADEPAARRVRRCPRGPPALSAGGLRRRPRGVARRQADLGADLGHRLDGRRRHAGGRGGDRAGAEGARL
jgi:anthraniloyl-CoA monooxygenase